MIKSKVHAALLLLNKAQSLGVAELTPDTLKQLSDLLPIVSPAAEQILLTGESPFFILLYSQTSMSSLLQRQPHRREGQQDLQD